MTSDSSNTYTYDAEGNVTKVVGPAGTSSYAYDVFNRRIHAQTPSATTEYTHDYAGRRVSSWLSPNNYGNEGRIYWDGEQTGFRSTDGTTYFDHQDTLGTERMRTNYGGAVGSSYVSLPWGDGFTATVNNSGADQDNAQFAGLERDADLATEHAQFRNYATAQGRWLSPDPALGSYDLTNPESFNRYPYALNNPTSFTDKGGREVCLSSTWGEGCVGGGDDDDDDDDDGGLGWGPSPDPPQPGNPLPRGNGPAHIAPNYDPGRRVEGLGVPIGEPQSNWGFIAAERN